MASLLPETESQNFYRLVSLLVDNGSAVLRRLVNKYALSLSTSLDQHLSYNKTKLEHLQNIKHVLNQSQMDLLFPTTGGADIEKFDITLLSCLLKNICGKLQPAEKQAVEDLRNLRNEISGHLPITEIEENDFKRFWGQISQVITNIAQCIGDPVFLQDVKNDIQALWIRPKLKPASQFTELLLQWQLSDQNIREEMDTFQSDINKKQKAADAKTSSRFSAFTKRWRSVKQSIRGVKVEIRKVKQGIQDDVNKKSIQFKSEIRDEVDKKHKESEQKLKDEVKKKHKESEQKLQAKLEKKHLKSEKKLHKTQLKLYQ